MPALDALTNLDRRVLRSNPADRMVAPPEWTAGDGPVKPILLNANQRIAMWSVSAVTGVVADAIVVHRYATTRSAGTALALGLVALIFPLFVVAGIIGGGRRQQRVQLRNPAALRWLPPGTPAVTARFWSRPLLASLAVAVLIATELLADLNGGNDFSLIAYCTVAPCSELAVRRRWSRVEEANGGQVMRLARRRARGRGTSGLYFLPVPQPAVPRMLASTGPGDRSNAYRGPVP